LHGDAEYERKRERERERERPNCHDTNCVRVAVLTHTTILVTDHVAAMSSSSSLIHI